MIRTTFLIGLILLIFTNCNSSSKPGTDSKNESLINKIDNSEKKGIDFKEIVVNEKIDTSRIFSIKENCVFIIQMTTQESDSLENADPDSYEVYSENANNASMNASELLDRLKIKSIWSDKRYIECVYKKQTYILDTRSKKIAGDYCIMFKDNKEPGLVEIELLTEDILKEFFN